MSREKLKHYDLAVIGLGPAGATLARLLAPQFSILALDRKPANRKAEAAQGGFRKPCGGLLSPDAQCALAKLGLSLPLSVLVDPQIFAVRAIDLQSGQTRHYQRFYLNLDRFAFDSWLISLLPEEVDLRPHSKCRSIARQGKNYLLTWSEAGQTRQARAELVVGADGAASLIRSFLYPNLRTRHYLAIQQWFGPAQFEPIYSSFFDPEITDCYCWSLTKNKHFILGGAFEPKQAMQSMRLLRRKVENLGIQLGEPDKTEACKVFRPRYYSDLRAGQDNVFLLGEAAGLISPSSLEGISYALNSAALLAKILLQSRPRANQRYDFALNALRAKLLFKTVKAAAIYTPLSRRLLLGSGLSSISIDN